MLAEAVRRRSAWATSLASARRLTRTRTLQLQASRLQSSAEAADAEVADADGDASTRADEPVADATKQQRRDRQLKQQEVLAGCLQPKPIDSRAHAQRQRKRTQGGLETAGTETPAQPPSVKPESSMAAPAQLTGNLAAADVKRARTSLRGLAHALEDPRATVWGESAYQRERRKLKAATGKLDRSLYAMRQRGDFAQVEAVAYLWEEEFPQFATQRKHWSVICEHYALALNAQQRFQEVVDKFSPCAAKPQPQVQPDEAQSESTPDDFRLSILTSRLAQSVLVALGHLRDASGALDLLSIMHHRDLRISKVCYFHALNALLHDETFTDFEAVLRLCEELVTSMPNEPVPLSLLPTILMVAAQRGETARAMRFYSHSATARMSIFTEFRFEICLQELSALGEYATLLTVYHRLMASREASRGLKERISKCLLRKAVTEATLESREEQLELVHELLVTMDKHAVAASPRTIFPLVRMLLLKPKTLLRSGHAALQTHDDQQESDTQVTSAAQLRAFFDQYPKVLEWNSFALCESVVAGVRSRRTELVDDLVLSALDQGMPIKYAALEQVVVFYYKMGLMDGLERVADMVRALRLNQHIPLGIALTEIGMSANLRLGRFEEVLLLFEDFAVLDGERKRMLKRRIMLKSALKAYTSLERLDEAQAIRTLLRQSYSNLLDGDLFNENDVEEPTPEPLDSDTQEEQEQEEADDEQQHDARDKLREAEQPLLRRFKR